jgi:hypothetical protein
VHEGLGFWIAFTSSEGGALQRRVLADWETEEERAGEIAPILASSSSSS